MKWNRTAWLFWLFVGLIGFVGVPAWGQVEADPSPEQIQDMHATGSLSIEAVQGTPGAPAIGVAEVEVDLLHQNAVVKAVRTELDEHGRAMIDDIPLTIRVRPVVRVKYAGVTYQEVGEFMDLASSHQTIKVTCYEVTDEMPAWTIPIRQVMLSYAPSGIKVTEIMMVMNPGTRTWVGTEHPPDQPITMEITLPERAEAVTLGKGFHDWCCTSFEDGKLVNHLPLMPHVTELNLSYTIPVDTESVGLDLIAQGEIEQMVVMLPDQMHTHEVRGLGLGGTRQIADTTVRYYTASDLRKGDVVGLTITGLTPARAEREDRSVSELGSALRLVAIIGVVVMIGVVIFVVLVARFGAQNQEGNDSPGDLP